MEKSNDINESFSDLSEEIDKKIELAIEFISNSPVSSNETSIKNTKTEIKKCLTPKNVLNSCNNESEIFVPEENALLLPCNESKIEDSIGKIMKLSDSQVQTPSVADADNEMLTQDAKEKAVKCPEYFNISVPLVGKNIIINNDQPFPYRYDLAERANEQKYQLEKHCVSNVSYMDWRKQQDSRTEEEKILDEKNKRIAALKVAFEITKISSRILEQLRNAHPDETEITEDFEKVLYMPVSPLALLYAPHFVHTVMFCRGCEEFSDAIRNAADECYQKCHAMFPVPSGCNFETVYTFELKQTLPDVYDRLEDIPLDYGDYDISDSTEDVSTDEGFNESSGRSSNEGLE